MANNGNNIDLGSISWDISSIEKQILENRKQLEGYSTALKFNKDILKQQAKELQDNAKVMVLCQEMQRELNKSLEEGSITEEDYLNAMQEVNSEMEETKKRTNEIVDAQTELIQTNLEVERSMKAIREETRALNTLMEAGRTEAVDNTNAYKDLNKELRALKLEAKNLGAELYMMERSGDTTSEAYLELKKKWEEASEAANTLNDKFKELDAAIGDNQRSVGDYREAIKDAFSDIKGGFAQMVSGDIKGGFETVKEGFSGVKDSAKSLFTFLAANPWAAVIGIIVGALVAYGKAVVEHIAYISEANAKVEQLTGSTGELTNELRRQGEAINSTFEDIGFDEAIVNMSNLMDDFKLSSKEAFDMYSEGLVRGGAANDEFRDSINEYGALFAQNGYSAQQFMNILNSGIDLKIYSDKLPDAIKEAGLALNEQTKATRDALVNAFGASFSDDILKRVQSGKITVASALDEIADKAETTNLNQQQLAQLTADLFKGAGEDAGGSLVIFEALNHAQEMTSDNLTELQKQTLELIDLDKQIAEAKDEAFSSAEVRSFRKELDVTWKNIQVGWYKSLAGASEFFQGSLNGFRLMGSNTLDFFKAIPKGFKEVSKSISNDLDKLGRMATTAGDVLKKAFTLDLDGARASYANLSNQLKSFNSDTLGSLSKIDDYLAKINGKNVAAIKAQNAAKAEAQRLEDEAAKKAGNTKTTGATGDAEAKAAADAAKKAEAERKKQEAEDKKAETKRLADLNKAKAETQKVAEDLAKRDLEVQRDNAKQSVDIAKESLNEYIRLNAEKYKDDRKLTQAKLDDQLKYFEELGNLQKKANDEEKKYKKLALQQKIDEIEKKEVLNATELEEVKTLKANIAAIDTEYRNADAEVDKQVKEKKKETNEKFEEDILEQQRFRRALSYQQELIDLEAQGNNEYEIRKNQLENQTLLEVEEFLKKNAIMLEEDQAQYDVKAEIDLARKEIEAEMQLTDDENEKLRLQNQLDQLTVIQSRYTENQKQIDKAVNDAKLQALQGALGTAKGLFKENTLAYKAMAVAEATISTYLSATKALAEVPYPMNYVVMGVNIAAGLAQVAKIVSTKGYSGGGYTGDGGKFEPAGLVHKGEVVWSQEDVAAVGGAAVANAMRPTYGGYFNTSVVGGADIPSVQSAMMGGNITVILDENSVSLLADAQYSATQKGLGDMADNASIREGANFG